MPYGIRSLPSWRTARVQLIPYVEPVIVNLNTAPAGLDNVRVCSNTGILVFFDQLVYDVVSTDPNSANNPANYSISPDLPFTISSATVLSDGMTVKVTLAAGTPLADVTDYILTVTDVADNNGLNPISPTGISFPFRLNQDMVYREVYLNNGHLRTLEGADVPASVRSVTIVPGDLGDEGLAAIPYADLVTASALLDLVSEDWLRRVVDACADSGRAALFAMSYDGEIRWSAGGAPDPPGEQLPRGQGFS